MKRKRITQKAATRDFSADMLPHDRKTLFKDCLRQRPDLLRNCALVLFIALIPLFAVKLFANLAYGNMVEGGTDRATILAFYQIVAAVKIPCYVVMGLGFAAISRILRQWIWGEPVFFSFHLKMGLQQNGKRFALIFALAGIIRFLCSFSGFLGDSFLIYIPGLLSALFLLPIGLYMLSQAVIYDVSFGKSFSNGLALYLVSLLPTLGFSLSICLIGCVDLIPLLPVRILADIAAAVALPVLALGFLIFSCHIFDRTINPAHHPELVGKGLYRPDDTQHE